MEKNIKTLSKKRKHKSQFFTCAKSQGKFLKPKRLSCMGASQLLQMEESNDQVVNYLIQQLLTNVFDSINKGKVISQMCTKLVQQKVILLDKFQIYNTAVVPQQNSIQIKLEEQPKTQKKYKVINRKQKMDENITIPKEVLNIQLNKTNSSKSNNKFLSKQKLLKITNTLAAPNQSNKSIKSVKSNVGNSHIISSYRIPKSIEQENQNEKQRQRRQKQQIIKRLMRDYQFKLKQTNRFGPQPLLDQYRSFFTQPQTKQQQDLKSSFLHLRQLRQQQQKLNVRKTHKNPSSSVIIQTNNSNKQTTRTTKLPTIYKTGNIKKKQESIHLFAQGENGEIIKIKNNTRVDTSSRDYSMSIYDAFQNKPRQTPLKEVSNILKVSNEYLKNDKIKDENSFINQNASLVSTLCQSMDQEMLQRSIMENFGNKKGVSLKKSNYSHRGSMSVQIQAVKLPSIMIKKR